jgi:uncharacterized tellurite resistance protein B-like protein
MFGVIKDFFAGSKSLQETLEVDQTGEPTTLDLQIATAVILIEMASADHEVAEAEAQEVCQLLFQNFGVGEENIPDLIEIAVNARKEKGKIDEFVDVINDKFNEAQKLRILAMVWKMVIADGKVDKYEERFAKQMMNRFRLSPEQAEEAMQMALADVV